MIKEKKARHRKKVQQEKMTVPEKVEEQPGEDSAMESPALTPTDPNYISTVRQKPPVGAGGAAPVPSAGWYNVADFVVVVGLLGYVQNGQHPRRLKN